MSFQRSARIKSRSVACDSLESRQFLAGDYAVLVGGVLTVTGTSGRDVGDIIERKGKIRVHMNSTTDVIMFPRASVTSAIILLASGNDSFVVEPKLDLDVSAFGGPGDDLISTGAGDDRIEGESGNDALIGWAGDDRIYGQAGNDSVDGGDGRDWLYGDIGSDTLVIKTNDRTAENFEVLR